VGKPLLIIAALIVLGILAFKWLGDSGAAQAVGDPATGMIANDLAFKVQAEMTLRLTTLSNSMRQQMAGGAIDALVAKPTLDDLTALHTDMDAAQKKLATLGDSPEAIDAWLKRLNWDEFQRVEKQFRTMASAN
jgi:hypothetical protein